ncbi:Jag N-terminal domain-containing protein [Domibacillus tundrae]|uniref:Jag N-terminal domain-containing protein n=1 Tax=Domibacillus tundrae TaxID=1587527 RepID=UPI003393B0DB
MDQTIVVKGNTVQEAIHKALNMMNTSVTDVNIMILENGGTTFWGLQKKKLLYK